MEKTHRIHYLWVGPRDDENLFRMSHEGIEESVEEICRLGRDVLDAVKKTLQANDSWLPLLPLSGNGPVLYYNYRVSGLFPDLQSGRIESFAIRNALSLPAPSFQYSCKETELTGRYLTKEEFTALFGGEHLKELCTKFNWDLETYKYFAIQDSNRILDRWGKIHSRSDPEFTKYDRKAAAVPMIPLKQLRPPFQPYALLRLLKEVGLRPEFKNPDLDKIYSLVFQELEAYILRDNDDLKINVDTLERDITAGKRASLTAMKPMEKIGGRDSIKKIAPEELKECVGRLLTCDKMRADLEEYDEGRLGAALGHWDLIDELRYDNLAYLEYFADYLRDVSEHLLFARDPLVDLIYRPSYVAIDFGTKSTVVACCDDSGVITPLIIGQTIRGTEMTANQFENPTVMKFVDIETFLEAYRKRGRPDTRWNDLSSSYSAADDMRESYADEILRYVDKLKQWANDSKRTVTIVDGKKNVFELGEYLRLGEDAFDPIELYAYYIGLYVNNMAGSRIFLDYLMACPASYPPEVCDRILLSFKRGLKKSLPTSVQNNESVMRHFRVQMRMSEPAAYAVCAVETQLRGGQRLKGEPFLYGIYDFGGGTTDFSIGIYQPALQESPVCSGNSGGLTFHLDSTSSCQTRSDGKDRLIELTKGGEPSLGGENLLEEEAYRIFTQNVQEFLIIQNGGQSKMEEEPLLQMGREEIQGADGIEAPQRKDFELFLEKVRFTVPPHCDSLRFTNYVGDDLYARKNTLSLIEAIRPYWEGKEIEEINVVSPMLYYKEGEKVSGKVFDLRVEPQKFREFFEERIRYGIRDFMNLLEMTVQSLQNPSELSAGRSVEEWGIDAESSEKIHIFLAGNASRSHIVKELFEKEITGESIELHSPLDGEETSFNLSWKYGPTAKTGIAYGLLLSRPGQNSIQVVPLKQTFRFYIGALDRLDKCFKPFVIPAPPKDYRLSKVCDTDYIFYYTDNPNAPFGSLNITQVQGFNIELTGEEALQHAGEDLCLRKCRDSLSAIEIFIRAKDGCEYPVGRIDLEHPNLFV